MKVFKTDSARPEVPATMNKLICTLAALLCTSVLCGVHTAYADNQAEASGSTATGKNPDGANPIRKLTAAEISRLEQIRKTISEIDQKYPGPQIPKNAVIFKVTSVDGSGVMSLESGQKIIMEGVTCSPRGIIYLQKFITRESDRIVYAQVSSDGTSPVRAYIWRAQLSFTNDRETKKLSHGPVYSSLNETVLTSGWCLPVKSSTNAYKDRYEALSKIAPPPLFIIQ